MFKQKKQNGKIQTIPEFFSGKTIFLTGATGFMGGVLIEKLLRSCPDLKRIYVLVRAKKGRPVQERVADIVDSPLYSLIRKENPEQLGKIVAIEGDVSKLQLGICEEDQKRLLEEVNIIYHSAASVRFDDHLKDAILMNTRSTRELIQLGLQMKNLLNFTYISTAYCHIDRPVIEETMYPSLGDWRDFIQLAEQSDSHIMDILTEPCIYPFPNTYTYSKQLSEHVVNDLCKGKIPSVIFRPSIVIPTSKEPFPGWLTNFNGPAGLCIAVGKGILRSVYVDPDLETEYIPVDISIKSLITSTWKQCVLDKCDKKIAIYNCSNQNCMNMDYKGLFKLGEEIVQICPLNGTIWYPNAITTKCWYNHFIKVLLYQLLPALLIDGLLKISGNKPRLLKINRKIYIANMSLEHFMLNSWDIVNTKCVELESFLLAEDREKFSSYSEVKKIVPLDLFVQVALGTRKYLLKEPKDTFEYAKVHSKRMWYIYVIFNFFFYSVLIWFVFCKINLLAILSNYFHDTVVYFQTP